MRDFTQCTKKAATGFGDLALRDSKFNQPSVACTSWRVIPTSLLLSFARSFVALSVGILCSFSGWSQTTPATNIVISPISAQTARIRFDWTNGDGANRIVILKPIAASYTPSGAAPASNANYGGGADLGGGTKCVFNSSTDGSGTTVTVTGGLAENTDYTVQVYEYTGTTYVLQHGAANPVNFQYRTTTGLSTNWWTAPTGINSVVVQAWGAGGAGGGARNSGGSDAAGGGGAGGAYASSVVSVTSGNQYDVFVGAGGAGVDASNGSAGGDSYFVNNSTILAKGGPGGLGVVGSGALGGAIAGTITGSIGTTRYKGGDGAAAASGDGGGGGTSAGTTGDGTSGSGTTGGTGEIGGGDGANGRTSNNDGINASFPGGGGGGAVDGNDSNNKGGDGGNGLVLLSWSQPQPTITILGPDPTIGNPVFRVVFSTPINAGTFIGSDVTITGTTAGTESAVIAELAPNNGTTFSITVSGMTGAGTVIVNLAAGVVANAAGNTNIASNTGTTINYTHDVVGPTVAITVSGPNPTSANPIFQVVFNEPITLSSFVGTDVTLTGTALATTATINEIAPNDGTTFTITASGMSGSGTVIADIAAGVVTDRAATPNTNSVSNAGTTITYDISPPGIPGVPTAAAGPLINAAEQGTFTIVVPGISSASPAPAAGDILHLYLGGVPFLNHTLSGPEAAAASYSFTNVTLTGGDGPKAITARLADPLGNISSPSAALNLTLDTDDPNAPGNPTAAAGPVINIAENGTFSVVVPGISGTGAVANDVLTLELGGAVFLQHTLTGPEAAAASYTFTNVTLPGPNGLKSLTANVTDEAGNLGPDNPAPLVLDFDGSAPLAPSTPTSVAAPTIDGAEYTAGFVVNVAGIGATGAAAGDVIELLLGGVSFPAPLTNTLDAGEIAAGNVDFTITCNQLGADGAGKNISARITDVNGNPGAVSADLTVTLSTEPTAASSGINFTGVTTTDATVNFTSGAGTGTGRIIVARQGAAVSFVPSDNTTYSVNNDFAAATDLGGGNKVVGNATGNTITNLPSGDVVHFAVFEYNNCAGRENYFATALTGSQAIAAGTTTTVGTGGGAATIVSTQDTQAEAAAAAANFSFVIDDDGATNGADAAPTRITSLVIRRDLVNDQTGNWTNVIAGVVLSDGTTSINSAGGPGTFVIGADDITITSIPSALTTDVGYVGDNTTKTLQVKIWFQTSISALDIDNKRLVFTTDDADFGVALVNSSGFASTATVSSGLGNGLATVTADRLAFSTIPAGGSQAGTGFTLAIAATDVNGNVDLNQTQQVTITAPTVPATGQILFAYATPASAAANMVAGRFTWTNVKVSAGGNYTFRVSDTDAALPLLTQSTTGLINFTAPSNNSRIITDGTFVEPPTIAYNSYQQGSLFTLASPPPVGSIEVARFQIQDGVAGVDPDQLGTTLTSLGMSITNPGNLRFLGISDGTNIVASVAAGASVSFSGMSLLAEDVSNGGTGFKSFSVFASFDANVVDNEAFQLTITSVTTGNGGSTFTNPDGGGAATDPTANTVVVVADRLNILQNPHPTNLLIGNAVTPTVTVEATDNLGSRDLDQDGVPVGLTSDGNMVTTPTAMLLDGFGSYSSIVHDQTATGRILTTTNGSAWINDNSTAFNLSASNTSDIVADGGFGYSSNILYTNFQSVNITAINSVAAAQFIVRDGGLGGDLDAAPTNVTSLTFALSNSAFIRRAALYDGGIELSEVAPAGGFVTFPGLSISVPDDGQRTLTIRVTFTTSVTDNQQFAFTVSSVSTQTLVSSTFPIPGVATSSVALDNNRIEVVADRLRFTTQPNSVLLPQIDISAQPPVNVPVVRAEDVFTNTDLDYTNAATISCALNVSPSIFLTAVSGVYTYPGNFRYTETGNGTMTISAPGLFNVVSNAVSVQAGTATTITAGAASPATISSLVNTSGAAVAAFNFNVNDDPGGTPVGNNDGLPTLISQVIIRQNVANNTIADWTQALAGAILTDGTNNINAIAISPTTITFGGIPTGAGQLGFVGDNLTKNYTVRVYLRSALGGTLPTDIDGRKFEFMVTEGPDITLATNSTGIIAAQSHTSGNANAVAVVATTLRFTYPTAPTTVSLDTDFPGVTVEAVDANNNRDLGYAGTVRELSNPASASTDNGPVINTTTFTAGLLNFASDFKFTSGSSGANVTLTIKAGANTTCGGATLCATSPNLTLLSSFESIVMGDPTYFYSTNIPYVTHQEAADIQETPSSREIARVLLIDGSRVNYNYGGFLITTGTNGDIIANGDEDGAETRLDVITFNITNPQTLRRLALYSGSTELGEINVDALNIPDGTPSQDFTFGVAGGGALIAAPDNSVSLNPVPLSLRASFLSTAPEITDGDLITVRVANAVLLSGSNFYPAAAPNIGGITNGYVSPGGFNRLNVLATKLDFVTQPAPFAGRNEPVVGAAIVHARDQFNVLDTDFNVAPSAGIVTSQGTANVLGTFGFTAGVLNMNGLITYGNPGIGTLTVTAGGLSSLTNQPAATPPNVAIQCTRVDVIHVGTVRQDGGAGGVPNGGPLDQVSLLAGASDQVLFGFTFSAPHTVTGPNRPRVTRFTFTFNNSISGIFNNIRVFESTTGLFSGAPQVPSGNITPGTQTVVDFSGSPRDLTLFPNLTYFIMADVEPTVTGTTPNMKVSILDGGVGSPTQNNIQVEGGIGSQFSSINGPTFNFAAVAPPTLVETYPRIGQTNVDPSQPTLEMSFSVPVYTLDQQVRLYRKSVAPAPDVLVATLTAANGFPFAPSGVGAAKPLVFNIPGGTLQPNNEYYVFVNAGNLSLNTGICDASRNLFPGISYPGTFFFRTADPAAPNLLGSGTTPAASGGDPTITDITNNGATLNATFDKLGKAYYLICSTNNPTPPTNAEVISGIYPANTVVAKGQFDIGATHTISQSGTFSVPGGFTAGTHYVWITAESFMEKKVAGSLVQTGFLTTAPYGSTAFNFTPVGGAVTGPTLDFPAPGPSATPLVTLNNVTISLCSNSYQILNNPIIIYEGTDPSQTFTSPTPDQTFNLVLPAGFQFDVTEISPGVPAYGKVDLIGADFQTTTGTISYLSTSVLRITFTNFGAFGSKDQIVIRNLRIRSDGSRVGDIFRLGGTGIPAINDGSILARLSAQEVPFIAFDNSYSLSLGESWATTTFSETAIPDNLVPSLVTLTPYIPNAFDFGPTTFTGQGVNIDKLNVNGVTLDVPFNITVTHTDQNGCISDNPVQFVVYDDKRAIVITKPGLVNSPATVPIDLDQGPYCSSIPTFQINQEIASPAAPGVIRKVDYDNLDAYYMETLVAGIPTTSVSGTNIINPTDFGGAWVGIVAGLPQIVGSQLINGYTFRDYEFDDKRIVNASAISGGVIPYVYNNFKVLRAPATPGNYPGGSFTFYNGGSLGFVEFTGTFRNIANPVVKINRRQIVEFYVPAVPMVELVTPYSDLIINDPDNPPSNIANPNNVNNPGTFVFCEAGGLITVNGWPKAEPTQGTQGVFRIYNASVSGTQIMTGFTDFGTGILQIDPTNAGIKNGNNNIRIEYEYTDANGICSAIGTQVIRITPNPTALFTQTSLASPFVDATNASAYCEGKPIRFDATASSVSGGGATIARYTWLFDDATNSVSSNPNFVSGSAGGLAVPGDPLAVPPIPPVPAAGTNDFPVHFYKDFNTYNPSLVITSNFNCQSVPATNPVKVGGIPEVNAILDGTHVGPAPEDEFHFQSNNSVISSNDFYKRLDWDFGDGTTPFITLPPNTTNINSVQFTHNYSSTGRMIYDFQITTEIGCINSLSLTNTLIKGLSVPEDEILRTLIVLPRFVVTPANAYLETFEPATTDPNKIWHTWYTGAFTPTPIAPAITPVRSVDPSWELGVPVGKFTPTINGTTIWTTRLNGTYTSQERSAIYSPSFDLGALSRPMVSFDTYTQLEPADGVVLQYSIDNKNITDPTKTWLVLGTETDGENWYTDRGIAAKPGDQVGNDYGWSQKINDEWLSSRHALVDAGTSAIITDPRVVFRLALASAATSISGNGFGFDNVRIGERTRTILLESFSNSSNTTKSATTPVSKTSDEQYESEVIAGFNASLVGLEVVKLNYRVNFPGNDPLNMNNPGDPSSRALFYNVDRTPAARLDGYAPTPYTPFSVWGTNTFNTRTLRLAQAALVIRPETGPPSNITSSGKIRFFVDVTPTVDLDSKTILHLGVVEQLIPLGSLNSAADMVETGETSFEYVVKKLLPSASGTRTSTHPQATAGVLVAPLAPAPPVTYTFGPFEWTPELNKFYSPSTGDLGVIAFLQREDGDKEVFQAEIVLSLDDPPSNLVTGVEPVSAEDVKVYPNPANHEMTVQLPGALAKPAFVNLIDQTGRTALQERIQDGADRKTLNVRDLSSGVYILTIDMGQGALTRKKVMIVHQD